MPMPLTFKKPPLNEVVVGQVFSPRSDLLVPHFGRFWGEVADMYPHVAHASVVLDEGGSEPPIDPASGSYLPRVWYLNNDETQLIQLQQDRLHVNWRQTADVKPEYPRFPHIKAEFKRVSEIFESYILGATGIPVSNRRMEITYINLIPYVDAGVNSPAEFSKIFKDFHWMGGARFLSGPQKFASRLEFEPDEATSLTVRISTAKRVGTGEPLLRFELTARETAELKARDQWIDDAHGIIVSAFKDLTTDFMHGSHWGLVTD